jgi:dipeptidyl-peptidase 4
MKQFFWMSAFVVCTITASNAQSTLTNELIWASGEFSSEGIDGLRSMKDGMHYSGLEDSDAFGTKIVRYHYEDEKDVVTLATAMDIFGNVSTGIEDYEFSADEKKILIQTVSEQIYRHSFLANYYIYNTETKSTVPLADFKLGKQRLATFNPQGTMVAFVRDNNVYVYDLAKRTETQVTQDGEFNKIINGSTDWVYEEEFALVNGMSWSAAGDRLAYYKFNESAVREFSMDMFGDLYPTQNRFKYPKAGETNSEVSIWVYDLTTRENKQVNTGTEKDQYIPRIKWTQDNNKLVVLRMNRHQNHLELLMTDLTLNTPYVIETKVAFQEKAETYIDVNDALTYLKDGSFIWMSEMDNYNHIYHMNADGSVRAQLTKGRYDVIDFYGYDEATQTAYFSCTATNIEVLTNLKEDGRAMSKHIYCVQEGKKNLVYCPISVLPGTNDADFSVGYKYYIIHNSNANSPMTSTLYAQKGGKEVRVLVKNERLKTTLAKYNMVKKEFFTFTNSNKDVLNCWKMMPANMDPNKKYPVLVAIYGGPGSNTVADAWGGRNYLWYQLLCQQGYIVVSCDPRGTQYRGRAFKHSTYMNLGKNETEDFIDLAKHLGTWSNVDASRIGIQGWSYGGYMTSLCMTKGADQYRAGIAVAPVTNWKYYDSIYTERFLRTPQENEGGYENNSPINFVKNMKGAYLLVHGSADDNVHYQNTMDMITALVAANKQFDQFIYPNKNHGIYGGNTRLHLFTQMTNFLKENL